MNVSSKQSNLEVIETPSIALSLVFTFMSVFVSALTNVNKKMPTGGKMTTTNANPFKPTESPQFTESKKMQPNLTELMAQYVKQCAVGEV